MINRDHELSVTKQAEAVGIARSTVPRPVSAADLALMRQIDKLHTEFRSGAEVVLFIGCRWQQGRTTSARPLHSVTDGYCVTSREHLLHRKISMIRSTGASQSNRLAGDGDLID